MFGFRFTYIHAIAGLATLIAIYLERKKKCHMPRNNPNKYALLKIRRKVRSSQYRSLGTIVDRLLHMPSQVGILRRAKSLHDSVVEILEETGLLLLIEVVGVKNWHTDEGFATSSFLKRLNFLVRFVRQKRGEICQEQTRSQPAAAGLGWYVRTPCIYDGRRRAVEYYYASGLTVVNKSMY